MEGFSALPLFLGLIFFLLLHVLVERKWQEIVLTVSIALFWALALFVGGFWGWLTLVFVESFSLLGRRTQTSGRVWWLCFLQILPGIVLYADFQGLAIDHSMRDALILIYILFRVESWPIVAKELDRGEGFDFFQRQFSVLWLTASSVALNGFGESPWFLWGLLASSVFFIFRRNREGVALISWLSLSFFVSPLIAIAGPLFLLIGLPLWWSFSALMVCSLAWILVDIFHLPPEIQAVSMALAATTSMGLMWLHTEWHFLWKKGSSVNFLFTGTVLCAALSFLFSGEILTFESEQWFLLVLPLSSLIGAAVGVFLNRREVTWNVLQFPVFEKMNELLSRGTEAQSEVEIHESEDEEASDILGEVGSYFSWLVVMVLLVVVSQWLI